MGGLFQLSSPGRYRKAFKRLGFTAVLLATAHATALAQGTDDTPASRTARFRVGPVSLNPTLALTAARITNVFNEADLNVPSGDATVTTTAGADWWMRFGPTWVSGIAKQDWVYFHDYASERSANADYKFKWLVPLNRVIVNMGSQYINTRARADSQIDARAHRTELAYDGLVEVALTPTTFVGVRAERRTTEFDEDEVFLNSNLNDELSRIVSAGAVTVRYQLTPMTAFTFDMATEQARFMHSPLRDSDSTHVKGGVKFAQSALISGTATFGFRDFRPLSPEVQPYIGPTASVNLSYMAMGSTRA
jgi:hypothetical protein